jgi:hypothetical protein
MYSLSERVEGVFKIVDRPFSKIKVLGVTFT